MIGEGSPVRCRAFGSHSLMTALCFAGSQAQPKRRTVQGELDRALGELAERVGSATSFAGRTDRGVHATGQVAAARIAEMACAGQTPCSALSMLDCRQMLPSSTSLNAMTPSILALPQLGENITIGLDRSIFAHFCGDTRGPCEATSRWLASRSRQPGSSGLMTSLRLPAEVKASRGRNGRGGDKARRALCSVAIGDGLTARRRLAPPPTVGSSRYGWPPTAFSLAWCETSLRPWSKSDKAGAIRHGSTSCWGQEIDDLAQGSLQRTA